MPAGLQPLKGCTLRFYEDEDDRQETGPNSRKGDQRSALSSFAQTHLTELERDYVQRRLNEEQDALSAATSETQPLAIGSVGSNQSQQVLFETSHA
jgi:hypothetical protein